MDRDLRRSGRRKIARRIFLEKEMVNRKYLPGGRQG
jgi:hypothetical protein